MKSKSPLEREWERLCRKEAALDRAAVRAVPPAWKAGLEARVPEKALKGLESAFAKGFSLVFQHGAGIIGKTCGTEKLRQQHDALHRAALATGSRRDLRRLPAASRTAQLGSLALTTAEGAALGLLGVGMPDILLFLGVLLQYTTLILLMLKSSLHSVLLTGPQASVFLPCHNFEKDVLLSPHLRILSSIRNKDSFSLCS